MDIIKTEAKRLIEQMPDHSTWDDIMYKIYVRQKIDTALKAAEEGRVIPHDEVRNSIIHGARELKKIY